MSKTEPGKEKDFWDKIVAWAKFMGGLGAVIGAVLIPWILQSQSEKNQKVQVYAEIMSQREAGDTEIRAKMFDSLLSEYLNISSDTKNNNKQLSNNRIRASNENEDQIKAYKEKIVFLSILMENFQEYFNARPLFEDLYEKIDDTVKVLSNKKRDNNPPNPEVKPTDNSTKKSGIEEDDSDKHVNLLVNLKEKLVKLSSRIASKQVTMLSKVGLVSDMIHVKKDCMSSTHIPLFKIEEIGEPQISNNVKNQLRELDDNNCCNEDSDEKECDNNTKDESEWWDNPNIITLKKNQYSNLSFFRKAKERNLHAITIKVKKIEYPQVKVEINLYEYEIDARKAVMRLISERPYSFSVSFFDMPYMDNTRIYKGERFALILKAICTNDHLKDDNCVEQDIKNRIKLIEDAISQVEIDMNAKDIDDNKRQELEDDKKDYEDLKTKLKKEPKKPKTIDKAFAVFQVVTFKEEFMSLRDRPLFEEMLNKLQAN